MKFLEIAAKVLGGYRVGLVNKEPCLMLRGFNVSIAAFHKGAKVDAENIGTALELLAKHKEGK